MATKVFIDGEAGTTGLQIRERLAGREDIALVQVDPARRKDADARRAAMAEAEVAILCLPDAAARDSVALAEGLPVRFIDASTAHRVADGWTYGFPELSAETRAAIPGARFVANPGCYATGAIAILAPLVAAVAYTARQRSKADTPSGGKRAPLVPLFVLGFLAMVVLRTTGVLPQSLLDAAKILTTALLAAALFGLGTGVRVRVLLATGARAMALGAISTVLIAGLSYVGVVLAVGAS